jgi:hypothetical protein
MVKASAAKSRLGNISILPRINHNLSPLSRRIFMISSPHPLNRQKGCKTGADTAFINQEWCRAGVHSFATTSNTINRFKLYRNFERTRRRISRAT